MNYRHQLLQKALHSRTWKETRSCHATYRSIGQYLQPSLKHGRSTADEIRWLREQGEALGFACRVKATG